ncbi:hypothetical protein OH76DRAFT_1423131 [Lentinus brumalis]|uniref:Uncharacterized protein n=1 Tax=Lentinus brumalis TaxID=2498619 RepID=A0A371CME2_9APHY|nr:hypothetical protein OH76DRAFT_1423131 [Polyporus brumalis]
MYLYLLAAVPVPACIHTCLPPGFGYNYSKGTATNMQEGSHYDEDPGVLSVDVHVGEVDMCESVVRSGNSSSAMVMHVNNPWPTRGFEEAASLKCGTARPSTQAPRKLGGQPTWHNMASMWPPTPAAPLVIDESACMCDVLYEAKECVRYRAYPQYGALEYECKTEWQRARSRDI